MSQKFMLKMHHSNISSTTYIVYCTVVFMLITLRRDMKISQWLAVKNHASSRITTLDTVGQIERRLLLAPTLFPIFWGFWA